MVDQDKPRQIVVSCDACGKPIVLYELAPFARLNIIDPLATFHEKVCGSCGYKGVYHTSEWREEEQKPVS